MLASAALVLGWLPSLAVAQLLTTDAKCLPGFEWVWPLPLQWLDIENLSFWQMFSSLNQSPCDVAAELAGVCVGGRQCPFLVYLQMFGFIQIVSCRIQFAALTFWLCVSWSQRSHRNQLPM